MRLETDPEFYFEFFLAEKLQMTVGRLRRELSAREFMEWSVYYGKKAQARELAAAKAKR